MGERLCSFCQTNFLSPAQILRLILPIPANWNHVIPAIWSRWLVLIGVVSAWLLVETVIAIWKLGRQAWEGDAYHLSTGQNGRGHSAVAGDMAQYVLAHASLRWLPTPWQICFCSYEKGRGHDSCNRDNKSDVSQIIMNLFVPPPTPTSRFLAMPHLSRQELVLQSQYRKKLVSNSPRHTNIFYVAINQRVWI